MLTAAPFASSSADSAVASGSMGAQFEVIWRGTVSASGSAHFRQSNQAPEMAETSGIETR